MAAIRSKGNQTTELRLVAVFRDAGITGWRRNYRLFGHPDFVFPDRRVAIFVDGCFWHGCKRCFRLPTSNTDYWLKKIARNRNRDRDVTRQLKKEGWKVVRLSECLFKNKAVIRKKLANVLEPANKPAVPPDD